MMPGNGLGLCVKVRMYTCCMLPRPYMAVTQSMSLGKDNGLAPTSINYMTNRVKEGSRHNVTSRGLMTGGSNCTHFCTVVTLNSMGKVSSFFDGSSLITTMFSNN